MGWMDVQAALRLAREAEATVQEAVNQRHTARVVGWLDSDQEMLDWAEQRTAAFGAVEIGRRIAALVPGAPSVDAFDTDGVDFDQPLQALARLTAALENYEELQSLTASAGPTLSAESLHQWVWDAASSFWADGHHRAAVHAAAAQIELHLQARLDRYDVSGAALIRQAFSLDGPQPGKPRLRFRGYAPSSERFRSVHEGASAFGAGLIQAFRNTAAHDPLRPLAEPIAIEQLAGFSLLARMIASADVEHHPDDGFPDQAEGVAAPHQGSEGRPVQDSQDLFGNDG